MCTHAKCTLLRSIIPFSGIRYSHSEFGGRALYPGFDPRDDYEEDNPIKQRGYDCYGHGTAVASVAAGNELGVAKNATIYSVRVLSCGGRSPKSVSIDGIDRAVEAALNSGRPSVISMSLSGSFSIAQNEAVKAATDAGIPVVVTAGNRRSDACYVSPASTPSAITVGGTARGDRVYARTSGGSCVDILAPGEDVLVADFTSENGTFFANGTSFAAPIVSGVLAMHLQERPSLSVQDLTQLLIDTSQKEVLDFSLLVPLGLAKTTPNRLVLVKENGELSARKELNKKVSYICIYRTCSL